MKKVIFLIAAIFYSYTIFGQHIQLNTRVSADLPTGALKISKEQALAEVNKKFNNDKVILNSIENRNTDHLYEVDNVLVSLFVFDKASKVSQTHLSDLKKGLDGMNNELRASKGPVDYYKSTLKKVNNNAVLIVYDIAESVGYYHFYCYNSSYTRQINGILEFDKTNTDEATVILNNLLNSLKFTE